MSRKRAEVALLEVEVDEADRPAGRDARGGEREVQRDGGRADAALGAGDGDQLAAERAAGRLLAGDAVAHRRATTARRRGRCASSCSSESGSATTSRRPACIAARSSVGRVVGGEQDQPDLGEARRDVARDVEHRHAAERVVEHDDVDVEPAQRAGELLGVGDAVDDLELLALAGERRRALGELVVGDREQQRGPGSSRVGLAVAELALLERRGRRPGAAARAGPPAANDSA